MNFPRYRKWYMSMIPLLFIILNNSVGGGLIDEATYTDNMRTLFDAFAIAIGSILVRQVPNEA